MSAPRLLHRLLRILKITGLLLLGLEGAYLLVANGLLWTGMIKKLVSHDPETITLDYDGAWTVWFGHLHLKHLALRGASSTIEWSVAVEDASLDVHLLELPRKHFHASELRGHGFVFRLRLRLTHDEADAAAALALPPIEGFRDPPLVRTGPPHLRSDAEYNLWTTRLDGVDVGAREIWIHHHRYVGDARTRGGFYMKPQRVIEVTPSLLDVRSGELTVADHTISSNVEGLISFTLAPYDPLTVDKLKVFKAMTGRAVLDAQIPGLDFLAFDIPPPVIVSDGSGQLRTDLSIQRGVIGPGSSAEYTTRHIGVVSPDLGANVEGRFAFHVSDDPGSTAATLSAHLLRATLDRRRMNISPLLVEHLRLELEGPELDLSDPPRKASARLDVPAMAVPDLRWFNGKNHLEENTPRFTGGAAFFQAHMEMNPEGQGTGRIGLLMKKAAFRWKDTTLRGDGEGKIKVESADFVTKKIHVGKSHLELRDVLIEREGDTWPSWWSDVDVDHADVAEHRVAATFSAHCKDAQPGVEFIKAAEVMPGWAADLLRLENINLSASIEHRDSRIDLSILRARGGSLDIRGRLKKPDKGKAEGAFLIKAGALSVGIAVEKDGTGVKPLQDDAWLDRSIASLGLR